jgi:hypothetical protein
LLREKTMEKQWQESTYALILTVCHAFPPMQ